MNEPLAALAVLAAALLGGAFVFWRRRRATDDGDDPLSPDGYQVFVELVRGEFQSCGAAVAIDDGVAVVEEGELRGRYGLGNVAQLCRGRPRAEWPQLIAGHFGALRRALQESVAAEGGRSFEEAAPLLAVRLWPPEFIDQVGRDHVVWRDDLPGTATVLVFDLPETIRQVDPADVAAWGKAPEELFALAINNLRRMPRPEIRRQELAEGVRVTLFSGASSYVASEVLRLEHFPGCTGRHGALVAVPSRHVLLAYPVESAEAAKAMAMLVPIVAGLHERGPGSISARLYWYHDGRFIDLPYTMEGGRVRLYPPAEFLELMNELAR
jgi:hypothetical protein